LPDTLTHWPLQSVWPLEQVTSAVLGFAQPDTTKR